MHPLQARIFSPMAFSDRGMHNLADELSLIFRSRCGMKEVCVLLCVTMRLQIKCMIISRVLGPFIGCLEDEDPTGEASFEQHMHFHEFIGDCAKVA